MTSAFVLNSRGPPSSARKSWHEMQMFLIFPHYFSHADNSKPLRTFNIHLEEVYV